MNRTLALVLVTSLILAGCAGNGTQPLPTTSEEAPAAAAATSTTSVEGSPTEEPAPVFEPQAITAANASGLTLADLTDLHREFLADPFGAWSAARWTPDGAYVVVETSDGFDTLDGASLELVYSADGYRPLDILADGRVAAFMDSELVLVDPATGDTESKGSAVHTGVIAVSQDGSYMAYVTGINTVSLVTLDSGEISELTISRPYALTGIQHLAFLGDSSALVVSGTDVLSNSPVTLINLTDSTVMYEIQSPAPIVPYPGTDWYLYLDSATSDSPGSLARPAGSGTAQFLQATFAYRPYSSTYNESTGKRTGSSGTATDLSYIAGTEEWAVLYLGNYAELTYQFNLLYSRPDFFILFWNSSGENTATITKLEDGTLPNSLAFAPDGESFVTTATSGNVQLWSRDGSPLAFTQYTSGGRAMLSPDGSLLAIPGLGSLSLVNSTDLSPDSEIVYPEPAFPGATNFGGQVHFAGEDQLVLSTLAATDAGSDWGPRVTLVHDVESGELLRRLDNLSDCETSYSGASILCFNFDNQSTQLVSLEDGALLTSFKADGISFIRLSQNGMQLSSCREGGDQITIQDFSGGANLVLNFACQDVLFLPGDTTVLLADGTLVDLESREAVGSFAFDEAYAELPQAFFSPDGDFVVIGNQVYDLANGALLATLEGIETLYGAALVDDGLTLMLHTDRGLEYWQTGE